MPEKFLFVTYTARYGQIWNWEIPALERLYGHAELRGNRTYAKTKEIAELQLDSSAEITIDGQNLKGKAFVTQMSRWESGALH